MSFDHLVLGLSLLTLITAAGCRSSDPLSGSWSNDTCYGSDSTPDDIESCGVALTFTDGLEISMDAKWVSLPATANYPGCITTRSVTGQSWSTTQEADFDVLHVEGRSHATIERNGCVYPADDLDQTGTSDISIASGDVNYQISDNVLTVLTGDFQGAYTQ